MSASNHRCALSALSLVVLLALLGPAGALAAPSLQVGIERTPEALPRNSEQLSYVLSVKNVATANPAVGETLTCQASNWFNEPSFAFGWLSDGAPASGPIATPTPTTSTYVIQAADAGRSIQCVVKGTNSVGASASFSNPLVVSPPPATAPPLPGPLGNGGNRPTVNVEQVGEVERVCIPPTAWTGAPTWTYQWLRDGVPIAGATGPTYLPEVDRGEERDKLATLQCEVHGTNSGGAAIAISESNLTATGEEFLEPPPVGRGGIPPINFTEANRPVLTYNATDEPVTLELELPAGEETRVASVVEPGSLAGGVTPTLPIGWSCSTQEPAGFQHAKVICDRADSLAPGNEFPGVQVYTSVGADAPAVLVARATVSGGGAAAASADDVLAFGPPSAFGIEFFETEVTDSGGTDYTQAGGHPFSARAAFRLFHRVLPNGERTAIQALREVRTDLPPGFIANPSAAPQRCESLEAVLLDSFEAPTCPRASIVGGVDVTLAEGTGSEEGGFTGLPLYMIKPERGVPAQLAFVVKPAHALYVLTPRLRPSEGYAISVDATKLTKQPSVIATAVTLCGYGTDVALAEGSAQDGPAEVLSCKGANDSGANPKPFLTNPTECSGAAPVTGLAVDSWDDPGIFETAAAASPLVSGCASVPFSPAVDLQPTSRRADSPTGLQVSISVPAEGLESPGGIAQSELKKAVVSLPEGMTVNPAAAGGLGACTSAQISLGTNEPVRCLDSSKIGTAEIETPLLEEPLKGEIYLAKQGDNPFHSLLALYLVAESAERGILVKIPGLVEAGPSGQLTATFDGNPQVPFSALKLSFNAGDRAALLNPPACGTYRIGSRLYPWSAPEQARSASSTFQVAEGPHGSRCPDGALAPRFSAGVTNPVAGSASPFVLDLSRDDGTQRFSALDVGMPAGLAGYLKGVPYCADAVLAAIPTAEGTGAAQAAAASCPAASRLGSVSAGVGAGTNPFYVDTGRAYLAGPYKGAPLSLAIVAPAVAGPFDLGNVVVRSALRIDPETARITVLSDPIPTVVHGIPLDVRDLRVVIDRPKFVVSPTSCETTAVGATVAGAAGSSVHASDRFQVGECAALRFKPTLKLRLRGGTRRSKFPALTATLTQPRGQANIGSVAVALPHSEFLEQGHIKTICTRVQFNAVPRACPPKSVYGHAEAWSPLLGYKLSGPVYLRSSSHKLPDLVAALRGPSYQPIEVVLDGRIDSVKGGIRNSFEAVPDVPVSKFVLRMQGGKKGLLVNSSDLCRSTHRATVRIEGQNGKAETSRPTLATDCGKAAKRGKRRRRS